MRYLVLFGLLAGLAVTTGCATVVKSPAEVRNTYKQVIDMDLRQMSHDWNYLWLMDRQYRLTRYYLR